MEELVKSLLSLAVVAGVSGYVLWRTYRAANHWVLRYLFGRCPRCGAWHALIKEPPEKYNSRRRSRQVQVSGAVAGEKYAERTAYKTTEYWRREYRCSKCQHTFEYTYKTSFSS